MKVFISWSGDRGRSVANALAAFIKGIVQAIKPWVSDKDIDSGSVWFTEILVALKESQYGVICITPEKLDAPFLLFEAGALASHFGKARVAPLFIGVNPDSLKPPLTQFHGRHCDEAGIQRLVLDIAKAARELKVDVISDEEIKRLWPTQWPILEAEIRKVLQSGIPHTAPLKPDEVNRELLNTVRSINERLARVEGGGKVLKPLPSTLEGLFQTRKFYAQVGREKPSEVKGLVGTFTAIMCQKCEKAICVVKAKTPGVREYEKKCPFCGGLYRLKIEFLSAEDDCDIADEE